MKYLTKIIFFGLLFLFVSPLCALDITPASNTLIDASFNGVNDGVSEEFVLLTNGIGNPAWNNATGQASLNTDAASNGTTGCVSSESFPGTQQSEVTASFTINNIVDPDGEPTNNGHWVGLIGTNTELWNNSEDSGATDGWSLGIRFLNGELELVYDNNAGNEVQIASLGTYTLASLQDGYTADFRFTADGWEVCVTGITGSNNAQGAWPNGFNYSFISSDNTVFASMTYQQMSEAGTVVDVASISVNGNGTPVPPVPDVVNPGPLFPFIDSDGDSYSDEAEIAFGTDAADADSGPDHRTNVKPNIVIIYADDMGFGELSAHADLYGTTPVVRTPNMDSLVAEGVTFTQGHSANGVCTPSRYSLLTGKYNWREFGGITSSWGGRIGGDELPRADDVTIAEFLKTENYDTAAMGKWHLGGAFYQTNGNRIPGGDNASFNNPDIVDWERRVDLHAVDHGFDHFRGNAAAINFAPYAYLIDDRMQFWDPTLNGGQGAYRPALNSDPFRFWTNAQIRANVVGFFGDRAGLGDPSYNQTNVGLQLASDVENYLSDRASSGDEDPFFLYVSMHSPHRPWAISPDFVTEDTANNYAYRDWMREVDSRVGRYLAAIDNNGFKENTIVVFTSDNGPEVQEMIEALANGADPNGPLRGNKRDAWDGGTRVPFVVRWPGQAAPGVIVNTPVWQGDIFATIAAFLGSEIPDGTAPDGESFLNLLRGQQKPEPQRPAIIMSSISGHLGMKTVDGWKFVDSTGGGGNGSSWDSSNASINNPQGTNRGRPKQLFNQTMDLGEDNNLIAGLTTDAQIRQASIDLTGRDMLGLLDQLRANESTSLFARIPDNDGDRMPNSFEVANGLDPDFRDGDEDLDGDGVSNLQEFLAGTDPNDAPQVVLLGDINLDGVVNFSDISPFVMLLANSSFQLEADMNLDESVNFFDISPFIAILSSQ